MKNLLYHKNKDKGKVYPSPSLSSSWNNDNNKDDDVLSQILPASILVQLVSVLSLEDREVLSYLLTIPLKSTTSDQHKRPLFDCGCFGCYTSFWSRWDSSPNRQLIHTVIEGFEQHSSKREDELLSSSSSSSSSKHRAGKKMKKKKKKDKMKKQAHHEIIIPESEPEKKPLVTIAGGDISVSSECVNERKENEEDEQETVVAEETEKQVDQVVNNGGHNNKGFLSRMVLTDVLGILNSRLWSLWSPNV